ncbi:hypothetical protein BGZ61DRAFT_530024 [Ilyonectria robusta]|uniref:uncharacterized protein n=1 Tax=Ilyonectria robusta TaxID=1079257 RepID=UPI001E8E9CA0|nr:uncharacterized protein BGZ61DRAFT_530024 [Ilyonectria robusta]KAH8729890.1 hypothetical protein BGZ61DRAFT_530024 [Ilyonectria robusta]
MSSHSVSLNGQGGFTLETAQNAITLRHLLNHTNGPGVDMMHSLLQAWCTSRGEQSVSTSGHVLKAQEAPLTFHSGHVLSYGGSLDYTRLLPARVVLNIRTPDSDLLLS